MQLRYSVVVPLVALACGCAPHIYSPPSQVNTLETSVPLKAGEVSTEAVLGRTSEAFDFEATTLTGTYRRGVSEELEIGADVNVIALDMSSAAADLSPYIWGGRLRAKWAPTDLRGYFAMTGGLGGGYHAEGGGYVSPNLGVVVSYPNEYIVPYLGASGYVSQPVGSKRVDISVGEEELGTRIGEAQLTWGGYLTAGISVPVRFTAGTLNLKFGGHILYLADKDMDDTGIGVMAGPEWTF